MPLRVSLEALIPTRPREVAMISFVDRVLGKVSSRRHKARAASRSLACLAEQLESRSMLSGIGVMPPVAPVSTGPVSPVMSPRRRRPGRAARQTLR